MKIYLTILSSIIFNITNTNAQLENKKFDIQAHYKMVDSLSAIDYLEHDYKYLDKNFSIIIDSKTFDDAALKYRFIPDRINEYKDSLGLVLMIEFNNWHQTRIAENRITYSWLRLGYHTWQSPEEVKQFANKLKIKLPWSMREFLIDENNQNKAIKKFFSRLIKKVSAETGRNDLPQLNRKELLNVAMRLNPIRIAAYEKLKAERQKQRKNLP